MRWTRARDRVVRLRVRGRATRCGGGARPGRRRRSSRRTAGRTRCRGRRGGRPCGSRSEQWRGSAGTSAALARVTTGSATPSAVPSVSRWSCAANGRDRRGEAAAEGDRDVGERGVSAGDEAGLAEEVLAVLRVYVRRPGALDERADDALVAGLEHRPDPLRDDRRTGARLADHVAEVLEALVTRGEARGGGALAHSCGPTAARAGGSLASSSSRVAAATSAGSPSGGEPSRPSDVLAADA